MEILQEHIDSAHLPPIEEPNKRDNSPGFFDKIKSFFNSNDKKDRSKLVKCERCGKSVRLSFYEKHIRDCRPPPPSNQLFSLMVNQRDGRRVLIRNSSNNALRNDMNELDIEARKMRELMLLMHLLLAQKPVEEKGLTPEEIENYSILCKYDIEKNVNLNEDYKKCSICQCDFELNEEVRIINCMHRYHKECADAWLKKKSWCPLCRKNVKNGEDEEREERGGEEERN